MPLIVSKQNCIARLRSAIEQSHQCEATHVQSASIYELLAGQVPWRGQVEVFELNKHPKAKRCYAWCEDEACERFVTALEVAPINSPQTAVRYTLAIQKSSPMAATASEARLTR